MAVRASVGDYAVIYSDGYKSVSPKKAFEDGYTALVGGDGSTRHVVEVWVDGISESFQLMFKSKAAAIAVHGAIGLIVAR